METAKDRVIGRSGDRVNENQSFLFSQIFLCLLLSPAKTLIKNLVFLARFPRLSSAPSASSAVQMGFCCGSARLYLLFVKLFILSSVAVSSFRNQSAFISSISVII